MTKVSFFREYDARMAPTDESGVSPCVDAVPADPTKTIGKGETFQGVRLDTTPNTRGGGRQACMAERNSATTAFKGELVRGVEIARAASDGSAETFSAPDRVGPSPCVRKTADSASTGAESTGESTDMKAI